MFSFSIYLKSGTWFSHNQNSTGPLEKLFFVNRQPSAIKSSAILRDELRIEVEEEETNPIAGSRNEKKKSKSKSQLEEVEEAS